MATSGTTSFDLTIEEIIAESYERCGLYVRSGYDLKTSRRSLNLLFKESRSKKLCAKRRFSKRNARST